MGIVPEDEQATVKELLDKLRNAEARLADMSGDITSTYEIHNPNWRSAGVAAIERLDLAIIALSGIRATIANRLSPYDRRDDVTSARSRWNPGNSGPGW